MLAIAKETIESISSALFRDERTFSAQEKELLANLLQAAQRQSGPVRNSLTEAIHLAVGETVARRAYGIFGQNILQQLTADLSLRTPEIPRIFHGERVYMPPSRLDPCRHRRDQDLE